MQVIRQVMLRVPFPPGLCAVAARLPEGLAEVALSRNIAVESSAS
jgi:hypothetical protein